MKIRFRSVCDIRAPRGPGSGRRGGGRRGSILESRRARRHLAGSHTARCALIAVHHACDGEYLIARKVLLRCHTTARWRAHGEPRGSILLPNVLTVYLSCRIRKNCRRSRELGIFRRGENWVRGFYEQIQVGQEVPHAEGKKIDGKVPSLI